MSTESEFLKLRRECVKHDFPRLNDKQFEAVTTVDGPLLILAGAGSGKTTVLVNRIAMMVKYGRAYESGYVPDGVTEEHLRMLRAYIEGRGEFPAELCRVSAPRPWEILAITFTNKAADELKERISLMLGPEGDDVWAGTFHSVCVRFLRRFGEKVGFTSHFTIYDTDDQKRLIKKIIAELDIDDVGDKAAMAAISSAKDRLIGPAQFMEKYDNDYRSRRIGEIYQLYQSRLRDADAMDFDDIIGNTITLFRKDEEALHYYQNRFKYILVDEYQDTNHAQYVLISLLGARHNNVCVVGDDDQSIYRFRGATIENILSFEDNYKNTKVVRLEQNYRSTGRILDAANAVIANNTARKGKTLWTGNGEGEKIEKFTASDGDLEAKYVVDKILENVRGGAKFSDHAVLYRINAQSNALENALVRSGVPYTVVGGHRFFDRKEIRDVIAYLQIINNRNDELRLRRIINEPKRGIGEATVDKISNIAAGLGVPIWEVMQNIADYPAIGSAAAGRIAAFTDCIESLAAAGEESTLRELCAATIEQTGYMDMLRALGPEGEGRMENVLELLSNVDKYEREDPDPTLSGFLEEVALVSDIDNYDSDNDAVVLMTLHSAKGLEFNQVFLVGLEEGIFPGHQSIFGGPDDIEEERRLAYVGITRARRRLYITNAYSRMMFGTTMRNKESRFSAEIPPSLCNISSDRSHFSDITSGYAGYGRYGRAANTDKHYGRPAAKKQEPAQIFSKGDRVMHKTFGAGTVLTVDRMGNDTLLEVDFDEKGKKKLFASFAGLKPEKE